MKVKLHWLILIFTAVLGFSSQVFAQAVNVQGVIYDDFTKKPVRFAVLLIPEAQINRRIAGDGSYVVSVPPGVYTFNISSPGLRPISQKINVTQSLTKDFFLPLAAVKGETIVVTSQKEIQKVSRSTLNTVQIKEAPATLGDSIGALATLPGVIRSAGFFGPLIIRGADEKSNRYFIDDIPVLNPQHFGGLQSVISNDIIREINLFSSSFPAAYGGAIGAIIDINTIDEVNEFGGAVDIGLISANFLIKNKWGQSAAGQVTTDDTNAQPSQILPSNTKNKGYWMAAGRVGYLSLFIPPIVRMVTGQKDLTLPEYYDYQLKGKYNVDAAGRHGLTFLAFGNYDTFRFLTEDLSDEEKEQRRKEGADPLSQDLAFRNDISSHSQGLYYDYQPSTKLSQRLVLFHVLNYSYFYVDALDKPPGVDLSIDFTNQPNVFGIKDKVRLNWWQDIAQLRAAVEYNLYYFRVSGYTLKLSQEAYTTGQPDIGTPGMLQRADANFSDENHVVSSYIENRFRFGGLEITPGVRADYLDRVRQATVAPRGLISYEFPTETTLAAASGVYYSYPQVNQFLFNQPFSQQPQVVVADYLKPEAAQHNTLSFEQGLSLVSIKIEGFCNEFYDQLAASTVNDSRLFTNKAKGRSRGVEVLIKKDQLNSAEAQFFGWLSYTYTRSHEWLNYRWQPFAYSQPHSLKLIAGFRWGGNQIGTRFELYSGFPYTEIIGSQCTPSFACAGGPRTENRYSQTFDANNPYGKQFPMAHRLDLRYTRVSHYKWGSFRWYIEVINVYNYVPVNQQKWNYNRPYEKGENPKVQRPDNSLPFIPTFGLEWRF